MTSLIQKPWTLFFVVLSCPVCLLVFLFVSLHPPIYPTVAALLPLSLFHTMLHLSEFPLPSHHDTLEAAAVFAMV